MQADIVPYGSSFEATIAGMGVSAGSRGVTAFALATP
jgi:hypothetical protein